MVVGGALGGAGESAASFNHIGGHDQRRNTMMLFWIGWALFVTGMITAATAWSRL